MCTSAPQPVNNKGETFGSAVGATPTNQMNLARTLNSLDPSAKSSFLLNWLTSGGPPKKRDPGEDFAATDKMSGVSAKAAAGSGIGGLFGAGALIGDLVPKVAQVTPGSGGTNSSSPMQAGVPYSVPPLVKIGGKG